jgi:hypothetical protein
MGLGFRVPLGFSSLSLLCGGLASQSQSIKTKSIKMSPQNAVFPKKIELISKSI